jgi:uncharacterized protein
MEIDSRGMRILDSAACLALLGTTRLGRLALTDRALPIILPVNFAWFDASIAFKVGEGVVSRAAHDGQIVCFEADGFDEHANALWSVYAIGKLDVVADPAGLSRLRRLDLGTWAGSDNTYVQLRPELFSGRTSTEPAAPLL